MTYTWSYINMLRPQTRGAWTRRRPGGGYDLLPVSFGFDAQGNLTSMRDPHGNVRSFTASVSTNGATFINSNACDYVIATAPAHVWVRTGPGQLGVRTVGGAAGRGGIQPLMHDINDIFAKRPDIEDAIMARDPVRLGHGPSVGTVRASPAETHYTAQRAAGMGLPATPYETRVRRTPGGFTFERIGDARLTTSPAGVHHFVEGVIQAMGGKFAPLMRAGFREGLRQEMEVQQRLPVERYQHFERLRAQAQIAHAADRLSDEQLVAFNRQVWQSMVREAGLTSIELDRASPYKEEILAQVGKFAPDAAAQMRANLERLPARERPAQPLPRRGPVPTPLRRRSGGEMAPVAQMV